MTSGVEAERKAEEGSGITQGWRKGLVTHIIGEFSLDTPTSRGHLQVGT
jgi:hypothetical protein